MQGVVGVRVVGADADGGIRHERDGRGRESHGVRGDVSFARHVLQIDVGDPTAVAGDDAREHRIVYGRFEEFERRHSRRVAVEFVYGFVEYQHVGREIGSKVARLALQHRDATVDGVDVQTQVCDSVRIRDEIGFDVRQSIVVTG